MDELTLAIIIWTACAVVSWWIANTKGAPDAARWGVIGLLLGPLGVIMAIVAAKPAAPADPAPPASTPPGSLCPKCGKRRVSAFRYCQGCGADLGE